MGLWYAKSISPGKNGRMLFAFLPSAVENAAMNCKQGLLLSETLLHRKKGEL